jgi:hypothetical protein
MALAAACGDGDRSSAALSPTAPSAILPRSGQPAVRVVDAILRPFPGREDAYRFRTQELEPRYRAMGRSRFPTFVDPEGSVIWVGEYLRYRAAQCTHGQAFERIRTQINGGGVPAVCGQNEQPFPPRNEALVFRRELEAVYQARGAGQADTVVDDEGDVIWTMEYYRYVLSGCSHADATARIMTQIAGGGVPADCGGAIIQPLAASISVRNTPCVAPSAGPVSCQFVAIRSGGVTPYSTEWQFRNPANNQTVELDGSTVSPTLGCGYSSGVTTFNLAITLTVRESTGTRVTVTGNQQVARAAGACGT